MQWEQCTAGGMESCQRDVGEVDHKGFLIDGQQADGFSPEHFTEEDIVFFPAEMAVAVDGAYEHVVLVVDLRFPRRIGARRSLVHTGRSLHGERLMRPYLVIVLTEAIQFALLGTPVLSRAQLLLEGAVHAFVSSVLLRMSGLDAFRHDAQLDPPDRQPRQAAERRRGERRPVVGADGSRQPMLAESSFEDGAYPLGIGL